jgi:hypothetical protein
LASVKLGQRLNAIGFFSAGNKFGVIVGSCELV